MSSSTTSSTSTTTIPVGPYRSGTFRLVDYAGWTYKLSIDFGRLSKDTFHFRKSIEESPPGLARLYVEIDDPAIVTSAVGDTPGRRPPPGMPPNVGAFFPLPSQDAITVSQIDNMNRCGDSTDQLTPSRYTPFAPRVTNPGRFPSLGGIRCGDLERWPDEPNDFTNLAREHAEAEVDRRLAQIQAAGHPIAIVEVGPGDEWDHSCTLYFFPDGTIEYGQAIPQPSGEISRRCKIEEAD